MVKDNALTASTILAHLALSFFLFNSLIGTTYIRNKLTTKYKGMDIIEQRTRIDVHGISMSKAELTTRLKYEV